MKWPTIGDTFEGYRLDAVLGEGGNGTVFSGRAVGSGVRCAIKVIKPPPGAPYPDDVRARFGREVTILSNLSSPYTVRLLAHGESREGLLYIVFEHVEGRDLSDFLRRDARLEPDVVERVLIQVLASLEEAHRAGLLHRDIKPENIFICGDAEDPWRAKLLDFGIARRAIRGQQKVTKTGELVGTPRYMSPEQIMDRPLNASSDLYSLGLVGIEMLSGRSALHGGAMADQLDRLSSEHTFTVPVDGKLRHVLRRMTAREPVDRFQSAVAVITAIERGSPAPPVSDTPLHQSPPAPVNTRLAAGAALGLAALAVIGWATLSPQGAEEPAVSPVFRATPPSIVKGAAPPPSSRNAVRDLVDAEVGDRPDAATSMTGNLGCTAPPNPFRRERVLSVGLAQRRWFVHVPQGYTGERELPLLVLLHGNMDSYTDFARNGGFTELADRTAEFIVISVDAVEPRDALSVGSIVADAQTSLCIDASRVFVVSHGAAGELAERLSCLDWVKGIALSSYPRMPSDRGCARPTLELVPMRSHHLWGGGGIFCSTEQTGTDEERDQVFVDRNACQPDKKVRRVSQAKCHHRRCEVPYVSCKLDGGHGWPRLHHALPSGCEGGPPADFPAASYVWQFFKDAVPIETVVDE